MSLFLAARADFGFGNPNLAGTLFAMLVIGVWGFCGYSKSSRPSPIFWLCFLASVAFAVMMIMTASRGAVVALGSGALSAWWSAGFPKPKGWMAVGIGSVFCGLFLLAASGRMGTRIMESSPEDGSITSRLAIYGTIPSMLVAAPGGWGLGKSAETYENWFQSQEDTRHYKHLISTHVTWMVERGWGFRLIYVLGWIVALILCGRIPIALGIWVCWGVAAGFSHVGQDWRLWIIPGSALLAALLTRMTARCWPGIRAWSFAAIGAIFGIAVLSVVGKWQNRAPRIVFDGAVVFVGDKTPSRWFYAPDKAVMGATYGKMLRQASPLAVTASFEVLSRSNAQKIILSGQRAIPEGASLSVPYDVVWLNPPSLLDERQKRFVTGAISKIILWGELRTDGNPRKLQPWFEELSGSEWVTVKSKALLLDQFNHPSLF